jgi:hypothetical protein
VMRTFLEMPPRLDGGQAGSRNLLFLPGSAHF